MKAGTPEERTKLTGTRDGVNESDIACTPANWRWVSAVGWLSLAKVERPSVRGTEGKFAKDRLGGLTGQDGVCALCKTHPVVASQQDRVLHSARWNNARPNRELSGRGVVMQKLDAEPDGGRGEEGGRFADTSPRTRGHVSLADVQSGVVVLRAGPSFSGDTILWGACVQEGY